MTTAVVFSPSLHGHRQTYCRVFAQVLLDAGFDVSVVAGVDTLASASVGDHVQLADLEHENGFQFVPLPESGMRSLLSSPAGFHALLESLNAEVVVLTEADTCISVLVSRVWRRDKRRWVGLFIRTTNYLHSEEIQARLSLRHLASMARRTRRQVARRTPSPRVFHEVLLPQLHLLDCALYLDETFVSSHPGYAFWLPDIFSSGPWRADGRDEERRSWADKAEGFLARQGGRQALVYIGRNQVRRGYDTLLHLAVAEDDCFLHCGRRVDGEEYQRDIETLRRELEERQALLEMDSYYHSDATADLFLRCANVHVLPYRNHLGSSGVMLQALAAGRPVLVPDRGLMAWRVRTHGLGRTYRHEDWDDLRREYRLLKQDVLGDASQTLEAFMGAFSREQTENALRHAAGCGSMPAQLPPRQSPRRGEDS